MQSKTHYNSGIGRNYLPSWGVWHGIREFYQNLQDATIAHIRAKHQLENTMNITTQMEVEEYGNSFSFSYKNVCYARIEHDGSTMLRLQNVGQISKKCLLLDSFKKDSDKELAGGFGEGMKFAAMALTRENKKVIIETGKETWTFCYKNDPKLDNAECLMVEFAPRYAAPLNEKNEMDFNIVVVTIQGITIQEWNEYKPKFLYLDLTTDKLHTNTAMDTKSGTLLLSDAHKGKIFVKGIYVSSYQGLEFGANLLDAKLDRERTMLTDSVKYKVGEIVANVLNNIDDIVLHCQFHHQSFLSTFVAYCYKNLYHTMLDGLYSNVNAKAADKMFDLFRKQHHFPFQPCHASNATTPWYPAVNCDYRTHSVLCKSSHYLAPSYFEKELFQKAMEYQVSAAEQSIIDEFAEFFKLANGSKCPQVKFKAFKYETFCFKEADVIYLDKRCLAGSKMQTFVKLSMSICKVTKKGLHSFMLGA